MRFRNTLEDTATGFAAQVGPFAEKVRDSADEVLTRLGSESRELGEKVGDRVTTQIQHLPKSALARVNLVTAQSARRRTLLGLLGGVIIGAVAVKLFSGEEGARRRQAIRARFGWDDPQEAAATTGELPK